jgi:cytochrome c biogenesis protein CcmG/thiol:disulfide interchange protein DsbE
VKPNLPLLVGGLVAAALFVALLATGFGRDPRAVPSVLVGKPAPAFDLVDLEGKAFSLESLKGTPLMLNFWSTWCGPCKYEHPLLLEGQKRFPGVRFLGVVYNDQPAAIRRYLAREGQQYPHLLDPTGRTSIDYGVAGVPESFFIDRQGRITHKEAGPLSWERLVAEIEKIR